MPAETETMITSHRHANHDAETVLENFQRNQKLPANSLPPEILHLVFLLVAGFSQGHYTRLLRLRVVCRYWMEVIDSTSGLWTPIKPQLHPELQAMIIRNSRNQLLTVEYNETVWEQDDTTKEERTAVFSSLVESSASRWESLEYRSVPRAENDRILSLPLHNLRRLDIDGWRNRPPALDAPKLSHVDVAHFPLNWRSLSDLQVLKLSMANPTLNELMDMLRASPGLRHLSLHKTWLEFAPGQTLDSSKIFLPRLSRLSISGVGTESICHLLDSIETSSLKAFDVAVKYQYRTQDCTRVCELAGRYIGAFPLPQGQKQALVWIKAWRREIMFALGGRKISILNYTWDDNNDGPRDRISYLGSVIKHLDSRVGEEVKVLRLRCPEKEEVGEYLRAIHFRFPQIDHIRLRGGSPEFLEVFKHLDWPMLLGPALCWLLPSLTKLELDLSLSIDAGIVDRVSQLISKRRANEGAQEITQLRIISTPGVIDLGMVELFRQSVQSFELTERSY